MVPKTQLKNYYKILGVSRSATLEQIQVAYKLLAKKYHPDKNPDLKESDKFKDIAEAYDTLSDVDKRKTYNSQMSFSFDFGRWGHVFGGSDATNFKRPVRTEAPKGENIEITVDLTLEEIALGCEKEIKYNKWNICRICDGTGAKELKTCPVCEGNGKVKVLNVDLVEAETCKRCYGNGVVIDTPYMECQGRGKSKEDITLKVKIPQFISEKDHINIKGQGNAGDNGGRCGDLIIAVNELKHGEFERKNNDLYKKIEVSITDLVLGTERSISTLFDKVNIRIPAGTQTNTVFRLQGKGLKGDLFIELNMKIPEGLTEEQTDLFNKLRKIEEEFKIFDKE